MDTYNNFIENYTHEYFSYIQLPIFIPNEVPIGWRTTFIASE